ncbi:MAG: N-acetylmuramoyl-L-alanine amidase [Kofleriaceae bacterium]
MNTPLTVVASLVLALATPVAARAQAAAVAAPASRPLVVLDAGHGGSNSGATGTVAGLLEKQLTLAVARRVRDLLVADGVDVRLTRDRDATLTLRQRAALANQHAADVFVSIHANASPERVQRGYETYVLTAAGVDIDGRALRSETGTPRHGVDAETALVLDDLERGAAQWEAADLAGAIQRELRGVRGAAGDRGVRQDAHHVLLGATMPAVLVEIGFIDHPIEGRELAVPATQDAIAGALARAIVAACPTSRR